MTGYLPSPSKLAVGGLDGALRGDADNAPDASSWQAPDPMVRPAALSGPKSLPDVGRPVATPDDPAQLLDRPVWSALTSRQTAVARGDARALRFAPPYGIFAAAV